MSEKDSAARDRARQSPAEALFARVGLAAVAFAAIGALLILDIALGEAPTGDPTRGFAVVLTARDGRALGSGWHGIELVLSPDMFYRNRPSQADDLYRINAWGTRGREIDASPTRPRVLVLGGSAAFGLGRPEWATFVGRLAKRRPDLEFVNAGVTGYVSGQELAALALQHTALRPILVVDFTGWNDLYNPYWQVAMGVDPDPRPGNYSVLLLEDRLARLHAAERSPVTALAQAWAPLAARSRLLGWLSRLLPARREAPRPALAQFELAATLDAFTTNIARMREISAQLGADLLVVLQPEAGQVMAPARREQLRERDFLPGDRYWEAFPELYRRFRRRAAEDLRARGVTVVDANDWLRQRGESVDFDDPVHLAATGHAAMADLIESALPPPGAGGRDEGSQGLDGKLGE